MCFHVNFVTADLFFFNRNNNLCICVCMYTHAHTHTHNFTLTFIAPCRTHIASISTKGRTNANAKHLDFLWSVLALSCLTAREQTKNTTWKISAQVADLTGSPRATPGRQTTMGKSALALFKETSIYE